MSIPFDPRPIFSYLGLPPDSSPSPETSPIPFLAQYIRVLPPHLLQHFSSITTAKERTVVPIIRNRRLKYTLSSPRELEFVRAKRTWPSLWSGEREKPGVQEREEGEDEKKWVESEFIGGVKTHVGKLGTLLGGYEEDRGWERARVLRRRMAEPAFVPEEDEDSDDETEVAAPNGPCTQDPQLLEESQEGFERLVKESFIYGLLDSIDYDAVDWNESLDDDDDRDAEERWFDEGDSEDE